MLTTKRNECTIEINLNVSCLTVQTVLLFYPMIRKLSSSKPKISDEQGASQAQLQVDKAETKHLKPYLQKYKFNMKELIMLKKRFLPFNISHHNRLTIPI